MISPSSVGWKKLHAGASRRLFIIAILLAIYCLCLGKFVLMMRAHGIGIRSTKLGSDVFFYLLTAYEPCQLFTIAGLLFLLAWFFPCPLSLSFKFPRIRKPAWSAAAFSLAIMLAVAALRHFVYLDYDVCIDEALPQFQSETFLHGDLRGVIPSEWAPFAHSATLSFETVDPTTGAWGPGFLPLHSLLRTPAAYFGLDGYMNAVLLAVNIFALYVLLRKIWPLHPSRATIGCLLFAFHPQVIITCMSSFAMEAHALFTTLWLLLYLSRKPWQFLLTPWLGILCMGIHQPHIHLIIAFPFVLRLLLDRRFVEFTYFCAVYLIGCAIWLSYLAWIRPNVAANGPLFQFGFNPILQMLVQSSNIGLLLTWSPPLLSLLFVGVILSRWPTRPLIRECVVACVLLFFFYFAWPFSQGHGWGYRFTYPAIPLAVIVGTQGLSLLRLSTGCRGPAVPLALSLAFTLFFQLPTRLWEVYHFVETHRNVYQLIVSTPSESVLVDDRSIWYGGDFIRNAPFFENRPVIISSSLLSPVQFLNLQKKNPSLSIIGLDDLPSTGHPASFVREQD